MRALRRSLIAAAIAIPASIGMAGIASASDYHDHCAYANSTGSGTYGVDSSSGGSGGWGGSGGSGGWGGWGDGPSYSAHNSSADPHGANTDTIHSWVDSDGKAHYVHTTGWAGPDGAGSHTVGSSSGG
jgi:hypothetical protein